MIVNIVGATPPVVGPTLAMNLVAANDPTLTLTLSLSRRERGSLLALWGEDQVEGGVSWHCPSVAALLRSAVAVLERTPCASQKRSYNALKCGGSIKVRPVEEMGLMATMRDKSREHLL